MPATKPEVHPADAITAAPNLRAALHLILAAVEFEADMIGGFDADLAGRRDAAARCLADYQSATGKARADLFATWAASSDGYVRAIGHACEADDFSALAF